MGSFARFLGLAVGAAILALTLREAHRPLGTAFSLFAGAVVLLALGSRLEEAVQALGEIAAYTSLAGEETALILKMLGVSFAAEFAAQACRDAGEESMAMRVELGGKVMLLILAAPLLRAMAALILEMTA